MGHWSVVPLLLASVICCVLSQELPNPGERREFALAYLRKYGYYGPLNPDPERNVTSVDDDMLREMTRDFQSNANVTVTGELDDATMRMMMLPRCGVSDKVTIGDNTRRKRRYVLHGTKWDQFNLTYRIINYSPDLERQVTDIQIERAFQAWADVTPLRFTKTDGPADIDIRFVTGDHGDPYPFDRIGGTLAHAFFPANSALGGDTHFDDSETWTIAASSGINLYQVAVHEFGHALGLAHSQVFDAVMFAFYRGYDPDSRLHRDDIEGIQAIYGCCPRTTTQRPTTPTTPTYPPWRTTTPHYTSPPTRPPIPEICAGANPGIDAITSTPNGTYVFRGSKVYKLNDYGIAPGYPVDISREFPGVPENLDAVLYWKRESDLEVKEAAKQFFFKGHQYWRFEDGSLSRGYPRPISQGFPGLPDNIDAAFVWGLNGFTYFIKDDSYYKYYRHSMVSYQKPLSKWRGLPDRVGAAMLHQNGRTYFFEKHSDNYYRYNDYTFSVDPGYPKSARKIWYGCDYYYPWGPEIGAELQEREEGMDEGENQFVKAEVGANLSSFAVRSSPSILMILAVMALLRNMQLEQSNN